MISLLPSLFRLDKTSSYLRNSFRGLARLNIHHLGPLAGCGGLLTVSNVIWRPSKSPGCSLRTGLIMKLCLWHCTAFMSYGFQYARWQPQCKNVFVDMWISSDWQLQFGIRAIFLCLSRWILMVNTIFHFPHRLLRVFSVSQRWQSSVNRADSGPISRKHSHLKRPPQQGLCSQVGLDLCQQMKWSVSTSTHWLPCGVFGKGPTR